SPQQLFQQAQAWMITTNPEDWEKAREGPIQKFLDHYADRTDDQANQMRAWADHVDLHVRERQLQTRMRHNLTPEGEAEAAAQNAVRAEEVGELGLATERWQEVLKYRDSKDAGSRSLGLLAAKRLQDLHEVDQREKHWRDHVDRVRYQ